MPVKYNLRCNICKACKADPEMLKAIFKLRPYVPGGESILSFSKRMNMQYMALSVHTKKHQTLTPGEKRKHEVSVMIDKSPGGARQAVIELMAEKVLAYEIESGGIKVGNVKGGADISVKDALSIILTGAKQTEDADAKRKHDPNELLKQMQGLRAGSYAAESTYSDAIEGEVVG